MTTTTNNYTWIGKDLKRREDPDLLTGSAEYTNDVKLPGMLHAAVLRSPYAHARIASIDTSAAKKLPGVHAVLTGRDATEVLDPLPAFVAPRPRGIEIGFARNVLFEPNLLELLSPIGGISAGRACRRFLGGRVHIHDGQGRAMAFGQGDGVKIGLVGVGREIGRVEDVLDVDHHAPPISG